VTPDGSTVINVHCFVAERLPTWRRNLDPRIGGQLLCQNISVHFCGSVIIIVITCFMLWYSSGTNRLNNSLKIITTFL